MPSGSPFRFPRLSILASAGLLAAAACGYCDVARAQVSQGQPTLDSVEVLRVDGAEGLPSTAEHVFGWGTAFVVAPGYLVTNAHVAAGPVRLLDTDSGLRYPARVVAVDKDNDLALLRAQVPGAALPLAAGAPVIALAHAFVMGYPEPSRYGMNRKYAAGRVRTPASADGIEPMTLYLSALPGNSGSPVCNDKGQVIGIIKGGLTKPLMVHGAAGRSEPMPVATPVEPLLALLGENRVPYATYGLSGPLEKVGEALAPSVYLVERTERVETTDRK